MARARKFQKLQLDECGQRYTAQIYFQPKNSSYSYGYGESFFFCNIEEHGINVQDTNIDNLISKVKKEFREKVAVEWTDYLEIKTKGYSEIYSSGNLGHILVEIEIKPLKIGVNPKGEKFYEKHQERMKKGEFQVGKKERTHSFYGRYDTDELTAIILDTPENREALELIAQSFKRGLDSLFELLGTDRIQETLSLVAYNKVNLLTAGNE